MDVRAMAVEPTTLAGLAGRWQEAADLLDASGREVAGLDPGVFAGVADDAGVSAAAGFRDDLVRRAAGLVDEAEARAAALRAWGGDVVRVDDEVAQALEGPR